jgi:hypothetical protein
MPKKVSRCFSCAPPSIVSATFNTNTLQAAMCSQQQITADVRFNNRASKFAGAAPISGTMLVA